MFIYDHIARINGRSDDMVFSNGYGEHEIPTPKIVEMFADVLETVVGEKDKNTIMNF